MIRYWSQNKENTNSTGWGAFHNFAEQATTLWSGTNQLYSRILNFLLGQFNQNSWHGICRILSSLASSNYIWVNWCLHKKSKWWSCEMFLLYDIRNMETQLVCLQIKPNKETGRGWVIFHDTIDCLPQNCLLESSAIQKNLEYLLLLNLKKTSQSHQNWHRQ